MSKNHVSAAPRLLQHDPCAAREYGQQMQRWSVHRSVCPSLFCEKNKKRWMGLLTRSSFSQRRIASSGHLRNKHRSTQWVYCLRFCHTNCSILFDYFSCFFLPGWFANSLIFYAVYVDMGLSSNSPVVLTVVTSGQSFARSFSVKVGHVFVFVFVFSLCCKFALALGQAGVHYVLEKTRPGEKYFLKITLTHKPWLVQGSWWEGKGSIFCTKSIMQSSLTFRDPWFSQRMLHDSFQGWNPKTQRLGFFKESAFLKESIHFNSFQESLFLWERFLELAIFLTGLTFMFFFLQVTQIDCYSLAKGDIAYHKRYELYTFESEFEKIICSFSLLIFSIWWLPSIFHWSVRTDVFV